jgi:serine/threonine protein kinase
MSAAMTPERWARLKALFGDALPLSATDRDALLARDATDDPALVAEVRALLSSHETPAKIPESVPTEMCAAALDEVGTDRRVGERIGAYRIVAVIGSGGMGDVYKAVRDDDQYHAEVAIKLMRPDARGLLAEKRFRTERQILAALDHRNIARLLDGGTADGLPYVVMELVTGEPIDRYCKSRSLDAHECVRLFLQVCAAVSFAHQHLVVHRDLKPNNIFVTADGSVKLLDFGIAKLLEPADTGPREADDVTRTQLRAMTLDYASPEQVSGGVVTTASDVYSLGVVLYRLLTGQSPYRTRTGDAQRLAEILGDDPPLRPSVAAGRAQRGIDSDLDAILLVALRKEPARRYASVEQFAGDLRNFLQGLPVQARGDALRYRLVKLLRRRRIEIAALSIVLLSLFAGLGFSIHEARVAERERATAEHERVVAQRHFDSVRKLANRLFDFHDEIEKLPGATRAREMIVQTSLEYLDALNKEAGTDRVLQQELASAYRRVGDVQGDAAGGNTGADRAALSSYAKAIALLESLHAGDPKDAHIGALLASTYAKQASRLNFTEGAKAAANLSQQAVAIAEASQSGIADEYERAKLLDEVYWARAMVLVSLGRKAEGMSTAERMLAVVESYASAHPGEIRSYSALSTAYSNLGILDDPRLTPAQEKQRSLNLFAKSMRAREKLVALEPGNGGYQALLAEGRFNYGQALSNFGNYSEALPQFRAAAPVLAARATDAANAQGALISDMCKSELGRALFHLGQIDAAEASLRDAEHALATLAEKYQDLQVTYILGQTRVRYAEVHLWRAERAGSGSRSQLDEWRAARDLLVPAVAQLRKVSEAVELSTSERAVLDRGKAMLARVEGVLTGTHPVGAGDH